MSNKPEHQTCIHCKETGTMQIMGDKLMCGNCLKYWPSITVELEKIDKN